MDLGRTIRQCLLPGLCALSIGCATPAPPWPATVVRIEDLKLLTPIRLTFTDWRRLDRSHGSTVVVKLHVDQRGETVRAVLQESSGSTRLDEAALLSVRSARFAPYVADGVAQDVTLTMPLHYPFHERAF